MKTFHTFLEVEEVIIPLIEYKEASIMNITITLFEEDVLKLLNRQYYSFLREDGGKNPQAFCN